MEIRTDEIKDAYFVFKQVFTTVMTKEKFIHKHIENPHRDMRIGNIVGYEKGVPCATNSFLGSQIIIENEDMLAIQSCDTAVLKEYRGRHLFTSLISFAIDFCRESDKNFIFGFPNEKSYNGFLKLGFVEVTKLDSFYCILRPLSFVFGRLKKRQCSSLKEDFKVVHRNERNGLTYEMSTQFPLADNEIDLLNGRTGNFIRRSPAFYKWKLGEILPEKLVYVSVRKQEALVAFFVLLKKADRMVEICDWYVESNKSDIVKNVYRLLKKYVDIISIPMINSENNEQKIFRSNLLIRRRTSVPFVLYITNENISNSIRSKILEAKDWSLRLIDTDYFLNM